MVLLAHELANFNKKIELKLAMKHWLAKYLVTIQTNTKFWSMIKKLTWYVLIANQTHPQRQRARGSVGRTPCVSHVPSRIVRARIFKGAARFCTGGHVCPLDCPN